ncbi:hypothetical protein Pmani_021957 [Petrolisthes manimaculis]|uniref:Uncharacterized protein n=1 Tax=Petrolisthes manimaculis TaxID=1843537 RepID=A0AAE1U1L9_9EUCA|nr:hypothetical protein Pmani_021957 [Petrolisthes manimaculis]
MLPPSPPPPTTQHSNILTPIRTPTHRYNTRPHPVRCFPPSPPPPTTQHSNILTPIRTPTHRYNTRPREMLPPLTTASHHPTLQHPHTDKDTNTPLQH